MNAIPRQQQQFTHRLYPPGPSLVSSPLTADSFLVGVNTSSPRGSKQLTRRLYPPVPRQPSHSLSASSLPTFIPRLPKPVGFAAACAVALLSPRIYVIHQLVLLSSAASALRSVDLSLCRHPFSSTLAPTLYYNPQLSVLVVHEVANLRSFALAIFIPTPLLSFGIPARQSSSLGDWSPHLVGLGFSRESRTSPQFHLHP